MERSQFSHPLDLSVFRGYGKRISSSRSSFPRVGGYNKSCNAMKFFFLVRGGGGRGSSLRERHGSRECVQVQEEESEQERSFVPGKKIPFERLSARAYIMCTHTDI